MQNLATTGFERTDQLLQHSRVTTRLPERRARVRGRRLQGTSAVKQTPQHPRQHAAVVLQFVADKTHRTVVSSMLKRFGDSKLIEGYNKKPTGPSLSLSVEYVSLEKRTYTCGSLALLVEHVIIQHLRCSPMIGHRCRRRASHRDLNILFLLGISV